MTGEGFSYLGVFLMGPGGLGLYLCVFTWLLMVKGVEKPPRCHLQLILWRAAGSEVQVTRDTVRFCGLRTKHPAKYGFNKGRQLIVGEKKGEYRM